MTFPKQGAMGALNPGYWWSECLSGLAHQFMRRRFSNPWQPIEWDGSLIDCYGGDVLNVIAGIQRRTVLQGSFSTTTP